MVGLSSSSYNGILFLLRLPYPFATQLGKNSLGGVPSVVISRENVASGATAAVFKENLNNCNGLQSNSQCSTIQIYDDITGHIGAVHGPGVSITPGFRSAIFHVIVISASQAEMDSYYTLSNNSYFGESAIEMGGFKNRYWAENYAKLLEVKKSVDPENFFWCRNCVGSDL